MQVPGQGIVRSGTGQNEIDGDDDGRVTLSSVTRVVVFPVCFWFPEGFLTEMEAAAPPAAVNRQVIALANVAGRSIPEFQGDPVLIRGAAFLKESLATLDIGPRND